MRLILSQVANARRSHFTSHSPLASCIGGEKKKFTSNYRRIRDIVCTFLATIIRTIFNDFPSLRVWILRRDSKQHATSTTLSHEAAYPGSLLLKAEIIQRLAKVNNLFPL